MENGINWTTQLKDFGCGELFRAADKSGDAKHPFEDKTWEPQEADRLAAWELYTELRTRITTQPLAYRHGDEVTALDSIYNIFQLTRTAIKQHEGCIHFATLAVFVLNRHIRPFTAGWHRVKLAGRLASQDTSHQFRRELAALQVKLRLFMRFLGHLAEGDRFKAGTESGIETEPVYEQYPLGESIEFGVQGSQVLPIGNGEAIDKAEREEVIARRKYYALPVPSKDEEAPKDAVGLAISGGGIRSATFSLGVVQFLARKGILKQADFVSTVSGGGYLGSFMSSYLNDPENKNAGLDPEKHKWPFGKLGDVESKAVRYLRNHSKYIAEGGIKTHAMILGMMMYGIAVNIVLTLPFILIAVVGASLLLDDAFIQASEGTLTYPPGSMKTITQVVALALLFSALFLPAIQNLGRNAGPQGLKRKKFSSWYERWWCVGLFVLLIGILLWNALPQGYRLYNWLVYEWGLKGNGLTEGNVQTAADFRGMLLAAGAAALPFLSGIFQFITKNSKLTKKLVMLLLIISGPLFFLIAFYFLCDVFVVQKGNFIWGVSRPAWLVIIVLAVTLYAGILLNINYSSPHRFYRRQLSRTYLRRAKKGPKADEYLDETVHLDGQLLSEMSRHDKTKEIQPKAPYHFINCALNIPACKDPNLRGRDSDFFVFSKHYSGSPIVGYSKTTEWEDVDGHIDLGTAMAISAAAASPQMGANNNTKFSYLLAILNVRLNYWVTPPRKPKDPDKRRGPAWLLRFRTPGWGYFFKELTGLGMDENGGYLNLSDGGHVENLAVYELLRRRCKFIIAIDGEADHKRTFHGLLTLVRLANIDLGVKIEPELDELRRDENGDSKSHFLLCKIDYGQGQRGFLLYIKSSMTGDETEFLQKYRAQHPTFPHESTADQLFDESQFEAYRALGEHVGGELFRTDLVDPIEPGGSPLDAQPKVRDWFQGLANSLLG